MLQNAPSHSEQPGFLDARNYKFSMFKRDVSEVREEKVCSPLAIAINGGDPRMVEVLLQHLVDIDIEFGL